MVETHYYNEKITEEAFNHLDEYILKLRSQNIKKTRREILSELILSLN